MKTHDELVKMQHEQYVNNMTMILNERLQELKNKKKQDEHVLDGLKIAVEAVGYPDLVKQTNYDIVNTAFSNILDLKNIDEQIETLECVRSFLGLHKDVEYLKG